jgi:hypothetical protein
MLRHSLWSSARRLTLVVVMIGELTCPFAKHPCEVPNPLRGRFAGRGKYGLSGLWYKIHFNELFFIVPDEVLI